ncbi:MAG: hypothetical protein AB8F65_02235 [Woeseiaceae bacterium]
MLTNPDLWSKLQSYNIGYSNPDFSFVDRLARDNEWSEDYAQRAMIEYKRFIYLALTGNQPVTPSDEVDQVWHLHLLYTRDYWGDFTAILGQPLHHGPTPGGAAARGDYRTAYRQTKLSYQAEFDEPPPIDLWPATARRFVDPMHFRRVDLRRYNLRKKPAGRAIATSAAIVAGLAATSALAHDSLRSGEGFVAWLVHVLESHPLIVASVFFLFVVLLFLLSIFLRAKRWNNSNSGCTACSGCGGCGGCG